MLYRELGRAARPIPGRTHDVAGRNGRNRAPLALRTERRMLEQGRNAEQRNLLFSDNYLERSYCLTKECYPRLVVVSDTSLSRFSN